MGFGNGIVRYFLSYLCSYLCLNWKLDPMVQHNPCHDTVYPLP